jgi:GTPase SAR1 family protein
VGGQKTLRTYWKNYFEKTDTLIWVVDATDRERIDDCRRELAGLLLEEVRSAPYSIAFVCLRVCSAKTTSRSRRDLRAPASSYSRTKVMSLGP